MQVVIFAFYFWTLTRLTEGFIFRENADNEGVSHSIFKRATHQSPEFRNHSTVSQIKVPEGYSIHDPPPTTNKSTLVEFDVLIFNVRDIKEINEELSLELRLQLAWKDSRLLPWVDYIEEGKKYIVLNPRIMEQLWYPDIFIDYVKSISQPLLISKPASLRLYNDTQLRLSTRVTITMSCPMDFHHYPADTQRCNVDMKSYSYINRILQLAWRNTTKPLQLLPTDKPMPNFQLEMAAPAPIMIETSAGFYSGIRFTVLLRRRMKFHLIQTYLPSALFVIVSWLSFLVPPEMVPGRMAICMTTLLTLTAMFSAVRQNIPKVSYIKALDIWMVTCAFFVFLTLLEYTIVLNFKARRLEAEKKRAARAAEMAAALIGQNMNSGKPQTIPDVSGQNDGKSTQPLETPLAPTFVSDEVIEKYTSIVIVSLFCIFNLIYWPWLLVASEYYKDLGDTQYYGV